MLYENFIDALYSERARQRKEILLNPADYLMQIKKARESIELNGVNPMLTENALHGLQELQDDFLTELNNEKIR